MALKHLQHWVGAPIDAFSAGVRRRTGWSRQAVAKPGRRRVGTGSPVFQSVGGGPTGSHLAFQWSRSSVADGLDSRQTGQWHEPEGPWETRPAPSGERALGPLGKAPAGLEQYCRSPHPPSPWHAWPRMRAERLRGGRGVAGAACEGNTRGRAAPSAGRLTRRALPPPERSRTAQAAHAPLAARQGRLKASSSWASSLTPRQAADTSTLLLRVRLQC